MSNSTPISPDEPDRLVRSLELYRDVSIALRRRIEALQAGAVIDDPECKSSMAALAAHQKALQTVLDLEVRLGKQNQSSGNRGGPELDLEAARLEIVSRIDVWREHL